MAANLDDPTVIHLLRRALRPDDATTVERKPYRRVDGAARVRANIDRRRAKYGLR